LIKEDLSYFSFIELILIIVSGSIIFLCLSDNLNCIALSGWQGLLAGVFALLAAWWTVHTMNKQTHEEKRRQDDALYRKSLAQRVRMPDALVEIKKYIKECFKYVRGEFEYALEKPDEAIFILKESVEFTDNKSAITIFEFISFYQIYNSRLESYKNSLENPRKNYEGNSENDSITCDTIKLNLMCMNLFDYARNRHISVSEKVITEIEAIKSIHDLVGFNNWQVNAEDHDEEQGLLRIAKQVAPVF